MFTGLVLAMGRIAWQAETRLGVEVLEEHGVDLLGDLALGDSVAVDGVCLTVMERLPQGFVAAVSPETLNRTTFGRPMPRAPQVNLEPALRVGQRLGGHFVTGHVDGVGQIEGIRVVGEAKVDTAWEVRVSVPATVADYVIPKGSIAVNGISLTVASCDPEGNWLTAAVIPHTFQTTNLACLQPGDGVNLEADVLGKYVRRFVGRPAVAATPESLSWAFLAEHGFA
ncbi:MAG: riboflavin synthase [Gloeomargaritaceae cyanobacterium C42_A2020_066]|nr:riboflavin synthase [Gloeomargaritaceae cyanobacterium C42_A2020_066]